MSSNTLPIRRIRMYQHGLSNYEHHGQVIDTQSIELNFQKEELNPILRSISAVDLDQGQIRMIRYEHPQSLYESLKQTGLQLNQSDPWHDLLLALRGQSIQIESRDYSGQARVMGLNKEQQDKLTSHYLLLQTPKGIRRIELSHIMYLEATDADFNQKLNQWLAIQAQCPERPDSKMQLQATGQGQRRVAVSYLRPSAGWCMSYRLYLNPEGKALLTGSAILENNTEHDWDQVQISLLGGQPKQTDFNIIHENARYGRELVRRPSEGLFDSAELDGFDDGGYELSDEAPVSYDSNEIYDQILNQTRSNEPQSCDFLVEYTIPEPVSLAKGQSAIVPVFSQKVEYQKRVSYTLDQQDAKPQAAVTLCNSSTQMWTHGPVVIYQEGQYIGEAKFDDLAPGQEVTLDYGTESKVAILSAFESSYERKFMSFVIQNKLFVSFWQVIFTSQIWVKSRLNEAIQMRLIYPAADTTEFISHEQITATKTDTGDLELLFELAPQQEDQLNIAVSKSMKFKNGLKSLSDSLFQSIPWQDWPGLWEQIESICELFNTIKLLENDQIECFRERGFYYEDQKRFLSQLQTLGQGSDTLKLRKQWLDRLDQIESKIMEINQQIEKNKNEIKQAQNELESKFENLNKESKLTSGHQSLRI